MIRKLIILRKKHSPATCVIRATEIRQMAIQQRIQTEKTPSNKTPMLPKIMNMDIWVAGTSNQLFIRGS